MIYKIPVLLMALLFLGCAGTESMRSFQESSLDALEDLKIERPVRLLGESKPRILDSHLYLRLHSGSIIFAPTEEAHPEIKDGEMRDGTTGNKIVWKNEHGPIEGDGMRGGVACPITEDGYFLTAHHVLENRIAWMWTEYIEETGNPRKEELQSRNSLGKIRVVYADKEQDFAIVKAPYSVRHFLNIRESSLKKGERVFGGGPWHNTGTGSFNSESTITLPDQTGINRYRKLYTSVPLARGDSGSPLVDQQGELCGVNVAASSLRIWIFSLAIMGEKSSIMEIIEKDRISHQ